MPSNKLSNQHIGKELKLTRNYPVRPDVPNPLEELTSRNRIGKAEQEAQKERFTESYFPLQSSSFFEDTLKRHFNNVDNWMRLIQFRSPQKSFDAAHFHASLLQQVSADEQDAERGFEQWQNVLRKNVAGVHLEVVRDAPPTVHSVSSVLSYLKEAVCRGETSESTAAGVADLLFRLSLFPVPVAAPDSGVAEDGRIFLLWDTEIHYLEAEVFPDGAVEYFYRNRQTGELWEADGVLGEPLPDGLNERFSLFS